MNALAKIHIAKKELGLDDDTYRALLTRTTGKSSSKNMSEREHLTVLEEMTRQGFKAASNGVRGARRVLSGPYAKKAQALWIAGWNLGLIRDRADKALLGFFERQTGIARSEWVLDAKNGKAVVEALKIWLERDGGVDWKTDRLRPEHTKRHGFQIATAQWQKLEPGGIGLGSFWIAVAEILKRPIISVKPNDEEWILVMNAFGKRLRQEAERRAA